MIAYDCLHDQQSYQNETTKLNSSSWNLLSFTLNLPFFFLDFSLNMLRATQQWRNMILLHWSTQLNSGDYSAM